VRVPGFTEVDRVSHSGNAAGGEFAYSLNFPDVHARWIATLAVLDKREAAVVEAFQDLKAVLPFHLLRIDADKGSEFVKWSLGHWCAQAFGGGPL
jgi:hypothetical protein